MRLVITSLLLLAGPALAADEPSGCGPLCGQWILDEARSDAVEPAVDAALAKYKLPGRYRPRQRIPENGAEAVAAEQQRTLDQLLAPPGSQELRTELLDVLRFPPDLNLSARDEEILIGSGGLLLRVVETGRRHSRVDAIGTARITTKWKSGALVITEKYDRRQEQAESYKLQDDGTLLVIRDAERPGLKDIRVQAVYRRGSPDTGGKQQDR